MEKIKIRGESHINKEEKNSVMINTIWNISQDQAL